MRKQLH